MIKFLKNLFNFDEVPNFSFGGGCGPWIRKLPPKKEDKIRANSEISTILKNKNIDKFTK